MKKFNKSKYLNRLKLKRYWQNNSRYFYIGIPCVLCLVLGIYFTYSKFFVSSEEDVVRTTVGKFIYGDIVMTPYIDGKYSGTFPEKKTGINVEKVVCDDDVTASWDEDKWGLYVTNLNKRTKCNIYFVTPASCDINDNVSCINSREGLATLATEVNNGDSKSGKIIYLTSDLDLGGKFDSDGNALDGNISWTPIGNDDNPFSGTFDGNGHVISNMFVSEENEAGLFLTIVKGNIKNFGIENSFSKSNTAAATALSYRINDSVVRNIYISITVVGKKSSAAISAWVDNSKFYNIYNAGNVSAIGEQFAAGLLGYTGRTIIRNCYNYGKISGDNESGGIVGGFQSLEIQNCYNLGQISSWNAGGIVGQLFDPTSPKIYSSYNSGTVSGGGIVGNVYENTNNNFKLSGNYYLKDSANYGGRTNDTDFNTGAEPLSADEMPSVISVINGDNAFVEDTNNINNGYPILKWQAERENN